MKRERRPCGWWGPQFHFSGRHHRGRIDERHGGLGHVNVLGVHRGIQDWVRDGLLIVMGLLSMVTTAMDIREDNDFTWFPIIEVAYLFVGIFITMIPCLLILKAGTDGQLAFLINAVQEPVHYFWVTGTHCPAFSTMRPPT
jgi:hypothetical protein